MSYWQRRPANSGAALACGHLPVKINSWKSVLSAGASGAVSGDMGIGHRREGRAEQHMAQAATPE